LHWQYAYRVMACQPDRPSPCSNVSIVSIVSIGSRQDAIAHLHKHEGDGRILRSRWALELFIRTLSPTGIILWLRAPHDREIGGRQTFSRAETFIFLSAFRAIGPNDQFYCYMYSTVQSLYRYFPIVGDDKPRFKTPLHRRIKQPAICLA
jgi:hypothetical protein